MKRYEDVQYQEAMRRRNKKYEPINKLIEGITEIIIIITNPWVPTFILIYSFINGRIYGGQISDRLLRDGGFVHFGIVMLFLCFVQYVFHKWFVNESSKWRIGPRRISFEEYKKSKLAQKNKY